MQGWKSRSRENNQKAITIIHIGYDCGRGRSRRSGNSGYFLKGEPTRIPDGWDIGCEQEKLKMSTKHLV